MVKDVATAAAKDDGDLEEGDERDHDQNEEDDVDEDDDDLDMEEGELDQDLKEIIRQFKKARSSSEGDYKMATNKYLTVQSKTPGFLG